MVETGGKEGPDRPPVSGPIPAVCMMMKSMFKCIMTIGYIGVWVGHLKIASIPCIISFYTPKKRKLGVEVVRSE